MKMNKKAWVRIVEAFVAVLLIALTLLILVQQGYIGKRDISSQVYSTQISILREIQLNESLRKSILEIDEENLPVEWEDEAFPGDVKTKIIERTPNYLDCEAKICATDDICDYDKAVTDRDIYAESVVLSAILGGFNPRRLKLFCWTK